MVRMKLGIMVYVAIILLLSNMPVTRGQNCPPDPDPETATFPEDDCPINTNILAACYNLNCFDERVCM